MSRFQLIRLLIAVLIASVPYAFSQADGQGERSTVRSPSPELGVLAGKHDKPGVLVTGVRERSPAQAAGLAAGDIIYEFGGQTLRRNGDPRRALIDAVAASPLNKAIRVVFDRGVQEYVTYVRFSPRPSLGIAWTPTEQGCTVQSVREGGLGEGIGIRPGDVIVGYGDELPVKDLDIAVDNSPFGVAIPITFERDGEKIVKRFRFMKKPDARMSSSQEYVLAKFGEPESFSIYFVAAREGSARTTRGETWNYHTLGQSFWFVDGELVSSEPLEPLGDDAVFPEYRPWEFNERTTIEDVVSMIPKKTFLKLELAPELMEGGVIYGTEQLSLGFKDDALVLVESIPLVPAKEVSP